MISLCLQGKVCDAHSVYIILSIAVEVHPITDVRATLIPVLATITLASDMDIRSAGIAYDVTV